MVPSTEQAWSDLHADIRTFVQRRVRGHADVDDIVQRVFLQAHRALPTLRDADRLHAWFYQTTRRAIVDHYRQPARTREVGTDDTLDLVAGVEPDEEPAALASLAACLRPLIAQLTPADQDALTLVDLEGLAQGDAAVRLGLSVSGMKSRVQRARRRLRTVVDACCRIELDRRGGIRDVESRRDGCGCDGNCS